MIRILLTIFFAAILNQILLAQSVGDFRSAVATGDWNINGSWQMYNGSTWVAAPNTPDKDSGVVTIQSGHTITFFSTIVDQLVINGTLLIPSANVMSFPVSVTGDAVTVNGILQNSGTITMSASPIVRVTTASGGVGIFIAKSGSVINNAAAANLKFDAGSTYQHELTSSALPLATWNITSTCLIKGTVTSVSSNLNQSFGNLTFEAGATFTVGSNLPTINGNLTTARGLSIGTGTLNILGSFSQSLGNTATTGTVVINIAKNFTWTGGSITRTTGTAAIVFNGTTTQIYTSSLSFAGVSGVGFNISVSSGSTLDLGTSFIGGASSTFTLNSGATLQVGSTNSTGALVNGTSAGNIRVSTTRNYNPGSTVIYNGAAAQFMGTNQPTLAGVTTIINNSSGVTLATTPLSINGNLTLQSGNFDISGRALTLGGVFTPNANSLIADVGTSLTINDTGSTADFGLLKLTGTSVIGNLTVGGTVSRKIQLGTNLAVNGQFTQTNGDFQLNGYTLNIQGGITQSGGTLTSSATSGLNISDEASVPLPVNLIIGGGAINTITMNRIGETLTTSSSLDVTNLDLIAGTFTHTGTIRINTNGKISVNTGMLTNPVTAISTYNVDYVGTDDVFTGAELPVSATILNDLTNLKTGTVYLSAPATINGSLILSNGNFDGNGQPVTLYGNFTSNGTSDFSGATFTFNGTTNLSGSATPQFGDVVVNSAKSLTLGSTTQINVAKDFTINGTLTPGQSNVAFNGSVDQSISGSGSLVFYKLQIDKTSGQLNLQSAADVQDALIVNTATTMNVGTNLLRLVSNASRTARVNPVPDLASITGSVIVQRYLPYGAAIRSYRYLTPTVTNTFVSDWQAEVPITGTFANPSSGSGINSTAPSLYYYDETTGGALASRYKSYPISGNSSAASLTNGLGYALFIRSTTPITLDSRGTLSQHQKIIAVTAQSNSANDGWNLIGNPYPSPVLWNKVSRSGSVNNAIYTRDNTNLSAQGAGHYVTYIGGVSVPAGYNGVIEAGQGFWVHATANGTVTFNETDKIISTDSIGQFYREASDNELLRLFVSGTNGKDEMVIRFLDEATDHFDTGYDALKLPNDNLNFFSLSDDGHNMIINTLGALNCNRKIALSMSNVTAGNHTLTATGLESFGSDIDLILNDKLKGIFIDLRTITNYDFSVSTDNINSIANRFVIEIGKSRIVKDLPVSTESVCFGNSISTLVVKGTQPEVEYKAFLKGKEISGWVSGSSGQAEFSVPVKSINSGNNFFTILAKNSCASDSLINKPLIAKFKELKIISVTDGLVCRTGNTTLTASGANAGEMYNWYKTAADTSPLKTEAEGKFVIDSPTANTSYFVSTSNSLGCESERMKVNVNIIEYENVFITEVGDVLVSNYESGNKWYYNGTPIEGAITNKLTVSKNGTYSVQVNINGCTTEASVTETITGLDEPVINFSVSPNPTTGDIVIQFESDNGYANISVISSTGVQVYVKNVVAGRHSFHTVPLSSKPEGVYIIKVAIGDKIITKKIIKV